MSGIGPGEVTLPVRRKPAKHATRPEVRSCRSSGVAGESPKTTPSPLALPHALCNVIEGGCLCSFAGAECSIGFQPVFRAAHAKRPEVRNCRRKSQNDPSPLALPHALCNVIQGGCLCCFAGARCSIGFQPVFRAAHATPFAGAFVSQAPGSGVGSSNQAGAYSSPS